MSQHTSNSPSGHRPRRQEASQLPSEYMMAKYRGHVLDPNTDAQAAVKRGWEAIEAVTKSKVKRP
jgi:hypothetical protein